MGSYATVTVRDAEVFSWRSEMDPTFLFLFTRDDVHRVPIPPDEIWDDATVHYTKLKATAAVLADRLDALGIGRTNLSSLFEELRDDRAAILESIDPRNNLDLSADIAFVRSLTLEGWVELATAGLSAAKPGDRLSRNGCQSLRGLLDLWDDADPRFLLRALMLALDPHDEVTLDVTDLVGGGWIEGDFDPQAAATDLFSYAMENGRPPVIIPEGSTDVQILRDTIELRFPHLKSYIRFFDYSDGAEGSASGAVRTLKSFAAAGISNRVVLLLDNDAAARDAARALERIKLPSHYTVMHYPDLPFASGYPALGPAGLTNMDVNGMAGSIELYLGFDVLDDGEALMPVQWRSYVDGVKSYQGELLHKAEAQRRFRAKVKAAKANPSAMESQDWNELEILVTALLDHLEQGTTWRDESGGACALLGDRPV